MDSSTLTRAALAAAFLAGSGVTLTTQQLFGKTATAEAAAARFQNEHTWVAERGHKQPDGGITTIYAGRTCGYALAVDGGQLGDVCSADGAPLTALQAASFEAYLKSLGVTPPR